MHTLAHFLCVHFGFFFSLSPAIEISHDVQYHAVLSTHCLSWPQVHVQRWLKRPNYNFNNTCLKGLFAREGLIKGVTSRHLFLSRFPCTTSTLVHTPPTWTTRASSSVVCCCTSVTPLSLPDSSRGSASSKVSRQSPLLLLWLSQLTLVYFGLNWSKCCKCKIGKNKYIIYTKYISCICCHYFRVNL